jgi:catechol 2,3-dioxygenase-like lactoylglutathione lyase family enzyme
MINGMHAILYSPDAEADRAFIRDVLGFASVDAGGGWLIFALPPAEVAVHPAESNGKPELYLMCDDVKAEVGRLAGHGISCGPISEERWGLLTRVRLPGGGDLGLYEPRHAVAHLRQRRTDTAPGG